MSRNELTATEQAEHLQRRKEIWEAMQNQVAQPEPPENNSVGYKKPPEQSEGFAAATQDATGMSKAATNKATRRAREVCQAARDLIRGTKLDIVLFSVSVPASVQRKTPPVKVA